MFVSPSHELQLIKGIRWLKNISLQEVHRGHLTKHYLLVTALAEKWSNVSRQTEKKIRLNKSKTQQIIITKNMINRHLTDIIWCTNQHIKVRSACFFFNDQTILRGGGGGGPMLMMGFWLWSSAGSAVTKCPDFELCVPVHVPSPWLRRRPAESLHCPLVVEKSHSSSPVTAPQNRPFFVPACMRRCANTVGKTRCVQLRMFLF